VKQERPAGSVVPAPAAPVPADEPDSRPVEGVEPPA
jgi:hypothetical protein